MIVAGPAFTSGRYGMACARMAAAASEAGLPALASMHPENPGLGEAAGTAVVESGLTARQMKDSLERFAAAALIVASGEQLTAKDGRIGPVARINRLADKSAAERAVALVLTRLQGDKDATEIPLPDFDQVTPAAPIDDAAEALFALVTEGGFVPFGNPDRLESARATKWVRYSLEGLDSVDEGEFSPSTAASRRCGPTPTPTASCRSTSPARWSRRARSGGLHGEVLATTGNGTTVADARRFGDGVGRRPAPAEHPGRDPHRHLRNRHALRVNAYEGTRARRDSHGAAVQPRLDRQARRRAADRAHARHPVPGGRSRARARGRARLAPARCSNAPCTPSPPRSPSRRCSTAIRPRSRTTSFWNPAPGSREEDGRPTTDVGPSIGSQHSLSAN